MSWKANSLLHECLERYVEARGGAVSRHEQEAFITQLTPLAKAVIRFQKHTDNVVKAAKKRKKATARAARKSLQQAERRRQDYIAKMQGPRRDLNDFGYANGHRIVPIYSQYPVWRQPEGGKPNGQT